MTRTMILAAVAAICVPMAVSAGPIDRACMQSARAAANPVLCGCLQQVADMTLRGTDQRRAAKLFADPEEAQQVRMSKSDRDNEFWARYKNFGTTAEAMCAPAG